jgi:hypothetical protein
MFRAGFVLKGDAIRFPDLQLIISEAVLAIGGVSFLAHGLGAQGNGSAK